MVISFSQKGSRIQKEIEGTPDILFLHGAPNKCGDAYLESKELFDSTAIFAILIFK